MVNIIEFIDFEKIRIGKNSDDSVIKTDVKDILYFQKRKKVV